MSTSPLRNALAAHLGQVLTPEVAAAIESSCTSVKRADVPMREKVNRLEQAMHGVQPVECPIRHYFAKGMYAREISIPKGVVVTGAIHKTDNLVVLSKGRMQIVTDEDTTVIDAPHTLTCKAGTKNAVVALEDSVWTNFFPTEETDPEKLVEILTFSKASELLGGAANAQAIAYEQQHKLEN